MTTPLTCAAVLNWLPCCSLTRSTTALRVAARNAFSSGNSDACGSFAAALSPPSAPPLDPAPGPCARRRSHASRQHTRQHAACDQQMQHLGDTLCCTPSGLHGWALHAHLLVWLQWRLQAARCLSWAACQLWLRPRQRQPCHWPRPAAPASSAPAHNHWSRPTHQMGPGGSDTEQCLCCQVDCMAVAHTPLPIRGKYPGAAAWHFGVTSS